MKTDRQFTKHFNFITKLSRSKAAENIKCSLHASLTIKKNKSFINVFYVFTWKIFIFICPLHVSYYRIMCRIMNVFCNNLHVMSKIIRNYTWIIFKKNHLNRVYLKYDIPSKKCVDIDDFFIKCWKIIVYVADIKQWYT